ncbi:MAG: RNA polymerase sigma factor, partial [Deltaproteobacteria bacterium]|nr:RNA polymerase sigma factor [Deltaproteobacteria bacterium]
MDRKQDKELIDLVVSGETQAFEALANRYYMTVYKYAFRWTTAKEDAEDITQEVFIKLANHLHTFN